MSSGFQTFLVVIFVPALCCGAIWLWYLARNSIQARVIIVALWLVLLIASIIAGPPFVIVMGAATVMMAIWIWTQIGPWWLR